MGSQTHDRTVDELLAENDELRERVNQLQAQMTAVRAIATMDAGEFNNRRDPEGHLLREGDR